MSFPNSVDDLIRDLDTKFPELAIAADTPLDAIRFQAGQRSVIHFLKTWRAQSLAPAAPPRSRGEGRRVPRENPQDQERR